MVRALASALGPPEGGALLDVGGGTGNYAQVFQARGFRVRVLDAQLAMLSRASAKLGPGSAVVGDAHALPFRDASFDRAMLVSALHLFAEPVRALQETRRVLRPGGVLALQAFTAENNAVLFVHEYFEASLPGATAAAHEAMLREAGYRDVSRRPLVYADTADGSLAALHTDPFSLAGAAYLRNTSFWHRLSDEQRERGLQRLEQDLRSGRLAERVEQSFRRAALAGHGTVFTARP